MVADLGMKIPYILPLFLGMTFDAKTSRPGVDIYDAKYIDNPLVTNFGIAESHYKVISNESEILNMLEVSGDLALKIKSGMIDVKGKGSYLRNERDYKNTVLVLATFKYTAFNLALGSHAEPRDGWSQNFSANALGTHYVNSITYGAEMIASMKFVVHDSSDLQNITGEVNAALGTETKDDDKKNKALDLTVDGKLDKLKDSVEGRASLEISFYGTIPLDTIPNTVDGLNEIIRTFGDKVKESNTTIPMKAHLVSLKSIAPLSERNNFQFHKDSRLEIALPQFEQKFDDLLKSRRELKEYARSLPFDLDERYQQEIGKLLMRMNHVLQVFYHVMWEIDVTQGEEQLQKAIDEYYSHEPRKPKKYEGLVSHLKEEIDKNVHKESDSASHVYVHWGSNVCPGEHARTIYEGFTFTGTEKSTGGASSYSCAPHEIEVAYKLHESEVHSDLAAIRYGKVDEHESPFLGASKDVTNKIVPCAKCYVPEAASIATFSATEKCPTSFDLLYKGYLMSARDHKVSTTEYICVDEQNSETDGIHHLEGHLNTLTLTEVHSEGILPSDVYNDGALIKCVVCSMRDDILNSF